MSKKLMLKQKLKQKFTIKIGEFAAVLLVAVMLVGLASGPIVQADQFDAQINALNEDSANKQGQENQLGAQATSLSDQISKLQSQIASLQTEITNYQNQISDLQNQINTKQQELDYQKKVLGEDIRAMYLEGDISTLEILASSKNLSDFVDKQQYRNSVEGKVTDTMNKIIQIKQQLKAQQDDLQTSLKNKQDAQNQLDTQQTQNNQLLSLNQDQQASLDQQIRANNSQVASLRAQQAAANRALGGSAVAGDPGHGGYPAYLDNAPQDSIIDPWGMYNRECVSYTAWKVQQAYGDMPYWGGSGNANQWPGNARAAGIPTGSTPRVHSVAISMSGFYGHAMWVEAVSGNSIYVSQYNYDLQGHYSEMWVNGSSFTYIYFQ